MAEQVVPGVYAVKIRGGYVNAYLIIRDQAVLIDSGLPRQAAKILSSLRAAGGKPEDLGHILVTHHHVDHAGSLAELLEATRAQVYVHPLDAPIVRGERDVPGPNPRSKAGKVLGPLVMRLTPRRLPPVAVGHEVSDGEDLPLAGGITVVHTPGHTAGHTCYLWREGRGVLFAGDAAGNIFGRLGPPFGMFTEDMAQAKESIRKIAALEFDTACFGHGGVIRGKAHAAFRRYVEKMAR